MQTTKIEFQAFAKISRLFREVIITEKIDGTNAQVYITEDRQFFVGSRNRWLTPDDDNFGFAAWAHAHQDELMRLGPGRHFGEWWGQGIQRNYGLSERRFSLFNVRRWCLYGEEPKLIPQANPNVTKLQCVLPPCCGLVPVLWTGSSDFVYTAKRLLDLLKENGSVAAKGFMKPEGIVVYHTAGNVCFKATIDNDEGKS